MFVREFDESFADQPADDANLWRYMDLARFLSLLEDQALYFARTDQMTDQWEGAFGEHNKVMRPNYYGASHVAVSEALRDSHKYLRAQKHINCWHENDYESAAMWDLYKREGLGIAVRTTWGDLTASITSPRPIFGGRIRYADYTTTWIPEHSIGSFMHKRKSFEHEREVRLIALTGTAKPGWNVVKDIDPEGPVVPVHVDLRRLINAVYVSPNTEPWVSELIRKLVKRYSFDFMVQSSSLEGAPVP